MSGPLLSSHAALNVHVTNRCALACRHCLYSSGALAIEEMTTAEMLEMVRQFSALCGGQGTLNLYGGEPLLRADLFEIVAVARDLGMRVGITTSGIASKSAVRKLSTAGFSRVTIDLHAVDPEVHDWIRARAGHHEQSLALIRWLHAEGVPVGINCALNRHSVRDLVPLLDLCAKLGVMSLSLYLLNPIGRGVSLANDVLDGKSWLEARATAQRWLAASPAALAVVWERSYVTTTERDDLEPSLCRRERADSISVRSDGNVYFCCLLSSSASPMIDAEAPALGNVRREPLDTILARRRQRLFTDVIGCPALALHARSRGPLVDPRPLQADVHPACPYDWQLLRGEVDTMRHVFAPIQP